MSSTASKNDGRSVALLVLLMHCLLVENLVEALHSSPATFERVNWPMAAVLLVFALC